MQMYLVSNLVLPSTLTLHEDLRLWSEHMHTGSSIKHAYVSATLAHDHVQDQWFNESLNHSHGPEIYAIGRLRP